MDPRDLCGHALGDRYRLVRLMGGGGMGAVYEAVDAQGGEVRAVKVIRGEAAGGDRFRRFAREAEVAFGIEDRHVVPVLDVGFDEIIEGPFLVMPKLTG